MYKMYLQDVIDTHCYLVYFKIYFSRDIYMNISPHVYCLWAKIKLTSYKTENVGLISFGPF